MGDERTDLERVGQFVDGPYDTDVTLYRADIVSLMGRDPTVKDDPLRLGGGFPVLPGPKIKAATNDWSFSPFLYLWEDQPYDDPGAWRRTDKIAQAELNISSDPFNSTVAERSMNGLGTYYGTFISEMEAFSPETEESTDDRLKGLSNFYTNPGKKGTGYGYLNICLNPYPEYMEDPAYDLYEARKQMREEFEAGMVGGTFVPTAHPGNYFDPNPFYDSNDPEGTTETYDWDRLIKPAGLEVNPAWIPSNYTKKINGNKDVMSPFQKVYEYDPSDPWEPVPLNVFRQGDKDPELTSWKAQFGNRCRQQRSTIQYNIKLWVNPMTFHYF